MNRREFLKSALVLGGAAALAPYSLNWKTPVPEAQAVVALPTVSPGKTIWNARLNSGMPDLRALYNWVRVPQYTPLSASGWGSPYITEPPGSWHDEFATRVTNDYNAGTLGEEKFIHMDIESWPNNGVSAVDPRSASQAQVDTAATYFQNFTTEFKSRMPGWRIAYYNMPGSRDILNFMGGPGSGGYSTMRAQSEKYAAMYSFMDAVCPQMYWNYSRTADPTFPGTYSVERWAREMMLEQRRLIRKYNPSLKIYPYVWERDGAGGNAHDTRQDLDIYQTICKMCFQYGDGVVIWGGFFTLNSDGTVTNATQSWTADTTGPQGMWWTEVWQGMAETGRYWPAVPGLTITSPR